MTEYRALNIDGVIHVSPSHNELSKKEFLKVVSSLQRMFPQSSITVGTLVCTCSEIMGKPTISQTEMKKVLNCPVNHRTAESTINL